MPEHEFLKRQHLIDPALLRTFVAVADLGSIAKAADHVGRSQPAASLQIKRLEDFVEATLFDRVGRGVRLSETGDILLNYARRVLELNDEMLSAVSRSGLNGSISLGIPQDFAEGWLASVLARFARAHPSVNIQVKADRNAALREQVINGDLDLALFFSEAPNDSGLKLGKVPIVWIGSSAAQRDHQTVVPLVSFEPPCFFRNTALNALDEIGKDWRFTFSSPSLACQWSAVAAGLGYSVRTPVGVRKPLEVIGPDEGLPDLGTVNLLLKHGNPEPEEPVLVLQEIIAETIRDHMISNNTLISA